MISNSPLVLACFVVVVSPALLQAQDKVVETARQLAQPCVDDGRAVGLSIGLMKGGKRFTLHLGHVSNDRGTAAPNDRTLYEIGSVTKVFTSLLLADEVARGKLKVDSPLAKVLPTGTEVPAGKSHAISLGDLATHHSGLPHMSDNHDGLTKLYAEYDTKRLLEFLAGAKLDSEPGQKFTYSNFGSSVLGYALTVHAGQDYETLITQRIFKPLKMTASAITLSDEQARLMATPHDANAKPTELWSFKAYCPAGGIRSNVVDMLSFVEAQLGRRKSTLDKAITLSQGKLHDIPNYGNVALGWILTNDVHWHNGQTGGFHTYVGYNRKRDIGVVVLCNKADTKITDLGWQIIAMLSRQDTK